MPTSPIGTCIAARRGELRLSQMDLAVKCDCSVQAISRIEQGHVMQVSNWLLKRLSTALNVPLESLIKASNASRRST